MSLTFKHELNTLAMTKGQDLYVFRYDNESVDATINVFYKFAANDELNFDTSDAKLLERKIRETKAYILKSLKRRLLND